MMNYVNIVTAFSAVMGFLTLMGVIGLIRLDREQKHGANANGDEETKSITRIEVFDQGAESYRRDLNTNERLLTAVADDGRTIKLLISELR
jgi:phage host-nuclease inhibitor protein Gam